MNWSPPTSPGEGGVEAPLEGHEQRHVAGFGQAKAAIDLGHGRPERLLAEDGLARVEGRLHVAEMALGRGRYHHGVDVGGARGLGGARSPAAAVGRGDLRRALGVGVVDLDEFDAGERADAGEVEAAGSAEAEQRDPNVRRLSHGASRGGTLPRCPVPLAARIFDETMFSLCLKDSLHTVDFSAHFPARPTTFPATR